MAPNQVLLKSFLCILLFPFSTSIHTITSNQSITDGDVLLSEENNFALGFFTPGNSGYRYVGIWYVKAPQKTVVWVANRDNPINHSSGLLSIDAHGNLVLNDRNRDAPLWSTNVSVSPTKGIRVAQLLDTGNLVLVEDTNKVVWQSFDYPCNTQLPGMKLGVDLKSGLNRYLTSWKSADDPGTGEYSYKLDPRGSPQLFLSKGLTPIWRTGRWPWAGARWRGYDETAPKFFYDYNFVQNENEIYYAYNYDKSSSILRVELDDTGVFQRLTWHDDDRQWKSSYSAPKITCDEYGECGAFSNCNPSNENRFGCECLPGFQPRFPMDWYLRDGSGGCRRKRGAAYECGGGDGFLKMGGVKLPDTSGVRAEKGWSEEACKEACQSNCSCTAYAQPNINGKNSVCLTWYGELIDIVQLADMGADLYVRVDSKELDEYARKSKGFLQKKAKLVIPILFVGGALILIIIFLYLWQMKKRKARDSSVAKDGLEESMRHSELSFLDLSTIVAATNNFSSLNKLGQGGFGSVYKGQLSNGQDIAVKRLSRSSEQGIEEFKNEVTVIAKLQHRNLVKLLGCCVQGEEKMLIYEFLPNKSLNSFIFDHARRSLLDWKKRFAIIVGIARGILYLHQDSRLRIIHRDLKTSNILLDAEMNPKISDFGMARRFIDDVQNNTNRIVGTYGYMSPEYASFGKFSTKSDVFSFGVILLEIMSGKKNSCYFHVDPSLTLIGHVWDLWREERALDMLDSSLRKSCVPHEVLRCIHIGLLCVEESVMDRPTMLEAVLMLVGKATIPPPKQPAFVLRRTCNGPYTSAAREGLCSTNEVTITEVEAR